MTQQITPDKIDIDPEFRNILRRMRLFLAGVVRRGQPGTVTAPPVTTATLPSKSCMGAEPTRAMQGDRRRRP